MELSGMSLFSGAGGMDVGFERAGIKVIVANELNDYACETYASNHPETMLLRGDIHDHFDVFEKYKGRIDVLFGGPPCQGFSVAGKMDPDDVRSKLIWSFAEVVKMVQPKVFVMENVKALGVLEKWKLIRTKYLSEMDAAGYAVKCVLLNSSDYGVPQKRERVFFIGSRKDQNYPLCDIEALIKSNSSASPALRDVLNALPEAGTEGNPITCTAKITLASSPILRKSPYAGMYFNGLGRPMNLDGYSNTLPASMGGNKTPIIDENYLKDPKKMNWPAEYHNKLWNKQTTAEFKNAPPALRRVTITEAAAIQTFPKNYAFRGSKSSIYAQIGNAVPCNMAMAVARSVLKMMEFPPSTEIYRAGTLDDYACNAADGDE